MEYFDILDEDGLLTGRTATRKETHEKGLWHRAVLVAVVDSSNKILIQQRSENKDKYPGKWDISVAGHVSSGYYSVESAYIEVMEEIGHQIPASVKVADFRYITSFRDSRKVNDNFIENQFYDLFVLYLDVNSSELDIQLSEVQKIEFVSPFKIVEMNNDKLMHPRDQWVDIIYKFHSKKVF